MAPSRFASKTVEFQPESDEPGDQEDDEQKADDRVHTLVALQTVLQVFKRFLGAERFEQKVPNVNVMHVPDILRHVVLNEHRVDRIIVHCKRVFLTGADLLKAPPVTTERERLVWAKVSA